MKGLILICLVSGVLCGVRRQGCDSITCDDVKQPVCGTDGVTYLNVCQLKVTACKNGGVGLQHKGECGADATASPSRATLVNNNCPSSCDGTGKDPVCGTDENTYANKCYFMQAQCKMAANGQKLAIASIGICPESVKPVLTNANPCMEAKLCDSTGMTPVCGSDGVTYASKCEFLVALCRDSDRSVTIVSAGRCSSSTNTQTSTDKCTMRCTSDDGYYPICGSDGQTYKNKCFFEEQHCRDNTLTVENMGECRVAATLTGGAKVDQCEPARCDNTPDRTCGSNGQVYDTWCDFQRAVCRYALSGYFLKQARCDSLSVVG